MRIIPGVNKVVNVNMIELLSACYLGGCGKHVHWSVLEANQQAS